MTMRKFLLLLFICCAFFPDRADCASYVPVDELTKGANIPRLHRLYPRMRYNHRMSPRFRGYYTRSGMYPRSGLYPRSAIYDRNHFMNMPRDPSIGKWVSPPARYLINGEPGRMPVENAAFTLVADASASVPRQAPAFGSGNGVKLFNTVEFGRPLNSLPGWLDLLKRNEASPIFIAGKYFNKKTSWDDLRNQLQGLSSMEQLRLVNRFWNTFPYREDMPNYGKPDYWAAPAEFLRKSGDCEDYAIVKYYTLKELGFDPQKMRIVVLRDTVRNLAHAVLAVYMDGDAYILDNLSGAVMSHKRMGNYSPQYSVNEFGRWAHIKSKGSKR